jgi:hypothetical protein
MNRHKAKCVLILVGLLFLASFCSPVFAQDDMEQETGISLTPRIWGSYIDPMAGAVVKKEAYMLPMFGATLAIRPGSTPNYNFLLTALFGSGEGDAIVPGSALNTSIGPVPYSFNSELAQASTEAERLDIEFLIRRIFPGKWFSIYFGPRYASWKETTSATVGYSITVGPYLGFGPWTESESADFAVDLESKFYALELGIGTVAEMSEDGAHRLFTNFVVAGAYTTWEATPNAMALQVSAETFLDFLGLPTIQIDGNNINTSIDTNLGYQYSGERLALDLRYRLFMVAEQNYVEQTQFTTLHGPELGISILF